jgi:hypothetical protein
VRWSDVDLARARLSVRRSVACTGYEVHTTPTTTRTSRRTIGLDEQTVTVLTQCQATQYRELGQGNGIEVAFTGASGQPSIHTCSPRPSFGCS